VKTTSDYVELSNFNVNVTDRKLERLCSIGLERSIDYVDPGEKNSYTAGSGAKSIRSDGNFFRVTFQSNDIYDATGFLATYSFRPIEG
jgi:hypothetical protein